jgi:hypothetical protein
MSSNEPTYSAEEMTCWPVSAQVGNVKKNDPSLIEAHRWHALGTADRVAQRKR